jgi:hypothetical protein
MHFLVILNDTLFLPVCLWISVIMFMLALKVWLGVLGLCVYS